MRDYIIATDSCCDFDENLIRELDLTVIPLSVCPQRHLSKRCHGSGRVAGGVS